MKSRSIILVIDAGSSSIRCISYELLDSSEEQSPIKAIEGMSYSVPMMSVSPNTGYIRIHEVLDAIDMCIDEVLRLLRESAPDESQNYNISALGFSTFVMNFVGVDELGQPVGDVATMSYACNRAEVLDACTRIERTLSTETKQSIYRKTGAPIHPAYALPQLIAFYDNTKDSGNAHLVEKVHQWKSISSICLSRWTNQSHTQIPISYSEASWTGMLNYNSCAWNDELLSILEQSCNLDVLPPLSDFDMGDATIKGIPQQSQDGSDNDYWNRWPELRQCRFFSGIGDGAAANIGSKCGSLSSNDDDKRRIAVTVGTSAAARLCLPLEIDTRNHLVLPFGLFCYRVDKSTVLLGGALTDGGSIIEWARSLFNLQSDESFNGCLQKVATMYSDRCDSTSPGVTMAPFLSGERSTGFRVGANGCIAGITRETTSIDIVYACLESVVLRLHAIIKLLTSVYQENNYQYVLVASGNALGKNHLWRQMIADCCGIDIVIDSDSNEGTSRGVALLVAKSLYHNCEEPLVVENKSLPNVKASNYWKKSSVAQESLIDAVSTTWGGN